MTATPPRRYLSERRVARRRVPASGAEGHPLPSTSEKPENPGLH